ncbi:IclR family transcriptional regulator [Phytoactinopolyspora halotolerans]|uniref:Glycerol operon regulatory protein n=1 Tax=Phytoactinopolyspora halotolerans TaxID=1981512 RepID=A0A6L9SFX3_9ACTN|nr:IclR family transcriptional regulator [Phytoactinopolyspora halotolerans]NEE03341.1 IclR family transcriptional regulator [Phytoactinopolyspora halotolerans]
MNESVVKAVEVLLALADHERDLGARDLSERTGLPRSTVQRLLQTFESCAMVEQDPVTLRYRLGTQVLHLGMVALCRVDVRARALPYMNRLRDTSGETVGLSIRVGDERMYIEQLASRQELRSMAEVGQLYPLYSGAPGRVLLAFLDDAEIDRILQAAELVPLTGKTPLTRERVMELVAQTRETGHAVAFEETIPGISTVAAPIRDHRGTVTAALNVSGPASRFDRAAMDGALPELLSAASFISKELGYVAPGSPSDVSPPDSSEAGR